MREDFLMQYYSSKDSIPKDSIPKDILLDEDITNGEIIEKFLRQKYDHAVNISTPKRGQFLRLTTLAKSNATEYLSIKVAERAMR